MLPRTSTKTAKRPLEDETTSPGPAQLVATTKKKRVRVEEPRVFANDGFDKFRDMCLQRPEDESSDETSDHFDKIEELYKPEYLNRVANPDTGDTLLMASLREDDHDLFNYLDGKEGHDFNIQDKEGNNALMLAIKFYTDEEELEHFIDDHIDDFRLMQRNEEGMTSIDVCLDCGNDGLLSCILTNAGSDILLRNWNVDTFPEAMKKVFANKNAGRCTELVLRFLTELMSTSEFNDLIKHYKRLNGADMPIYLLEEYLAEKRALMSDAQLEEEDEDYENNQSSDDDDDDDDDDENKENE